MNLAPIATKDGASDASARGGDGVGCPDTAHSKFRKAKTEGGHSVQSGPVLLHFECTNPLARVLCGCEGSKGRFGKVVAPCMFCSFC